MCSIIGSLLIFFVAMNALTTAGIGNIVGNDYLDIGVPGESETYSVLCSWGPSLGFYVYLIPCALYVMTVILESLKHRGKKDDQSKK
jgi:hypothetical protein